MEIFLVRHTAPAVPKGVCYGQADIDVTETFFDEAAIIKKHLPDNLQIIYSSPLQRCHKLATHLFPNRQIYLEHNLMEINCGEWELKKWDHITKEQLDQWMSDLTNVRIPGGESYLDLYHRCAISFNKCAANKLPAAIVAHGGVIRSILAHLNNVSVADSFKTFSFHYGCVIKLTIAENGWQHQVLSNIPHEKETHKPSGY